MPKDATKNIDRYKIRGGQLNEFDFHQNQEEYAEQARTQATNLIPGTPPEERAKALRPAARKEPAKKSAAKARKAPAKKSAAKARKAVKATKATKNTKATKASPRGATAKKLAARKAAKKK